jgi:hypothetical protein
MPIDYYPNLSAGQLLQLLQILQARDTTGITTEVGMVGYTQRNDFGKEMTRNATAIRRVLYSLHLRNPCQFKDPYAQRIARTRARYTFS